MPDPLEDRTAMEEALSDLIHADAPVTEHWIDEAELEAHPGLVKTMSVRPPRGVGRIRLVRSGESDQQIDLKPSGGTHVAQTAEIGRIRVGRIENKGRHSRRVYVHPD